MTLIEAANYRQTRRHYAKEITERGYGYALCSLNGADASRVDVYDQANLEREYERWGAKPPKKIGDLTLCKRCEKSAKAQGLEVPK